MKPTCFVLPVMFLALVSARAQTMQDMPGMEHGQHHHHQDGEKLGSVNFPVSCDAEAQAGIQRGVALLHSFGYTEARMQFAETAQAEPKCAMAHWGVAMAQFTEIWGHPGAKDLEIGVKEMKEARKLDKHVTPREKAYITALSAFYVSGKGVKFQQRADAYQAKMDALHAAYPEDVEGAAFDALSILASEQATDTSLTHEREALAILVPLFKQHPEHPGLAHYIIHTCDTPALAQDGLAASLEYAKIAPSSAHALHMPGHIFARLGMWNEDIASNEASVKASEKAKAEGRPGAAHQMHAEEFLIYAYLQVGDDGKAKTLQGRMRGIGDEMMAMPGMDDMKMGGRYFDNEMTAIYGMEMHDWSGLAALQPSPGSYGEESLDTYWGQGVAAGHLKDATLGKKALASYDVVMEAMRKDPDADRMTHAGIKRDEIAGWLAYAEGRNDEAEKLIRSAADEQDKLGQDEVDIPGREMLGDLLRMEGKSQPALVEYRVALTLSPNRLNGLLGAGEAAQAAGKPEEAKAFYRTATKQTNEGKESSRPELGKAVEFAGGQ